ncbi:MAG: hypothetical protein ACSLE0_08130 [Chitinophagaceae bacterium]
MVIKRYSCGNGDGMFENKKGSYVEYEECMKVINKLILQHSEELGEAYETGREDGFNSSSL